MVVSVLYVAVSPTGAVGGVRSVFSATGVGEGVGGRGAGFGVGGGGGGGVTVSAPVISSGSAYVPEASETEGVTGGGSAVATSRTMGAGSV